jgi:saccharopine dehydrogenase-like NADP-dependent oxidoreductase
MTKLLILGGYGLTGKSLARHLLEQTKVSIILAGRHLGKALAYAHLLNQQYEGRRVSAVYADAADPNSLHEALHGVDLLLVAAPTTRVVKNVAHAALDCGVDYLDVQLGAEKFAFLQSMAAEIERQGRCFITEAGFHPGLPSAMMRYAATHLDRLEIAITAGYLNMGGALPYTEAVDELMDVFRDYQGQVFKDGEWTKKSSYDLRDIDFGGDIGVRKCYSMFFEELRPLPGLYPALKETGFYISSSHWFVDWVLYPLAMAGLRIAPQRATRPMGRLVWWGMQTFPKPPVQVVLKVQARGVRDGKPALFEASVSHPDGYELTAIPVVAALSQYLDGSVRRPGLWMMGHLAEPVRLFADMQRMGVQVTTSFGPAG